MKNLTVICVFLCTTACFLTVQAAAVQTLASIEHTVVGFISSQWPSDATIDVSVQRLDQRLRLPECEDDLHAEWNVGRKTTGRVTVSVSCERPKPWRVRVQATVAEHTRVWVLNSAVRKGDVLDGRLVSQEQITLGKGGRSQVLAGTPITDIGPWQGYVFARAVGQGQLLTDRMLEQPELIARGDQVQIIVSKGNLQIQAKGTALGSGALDERIPVRNKSSGKVVQAIVASRTSVKLPR